MTVREIRCADVSEATGFDLLASEAWGKIKEEINVPVYAGEWLLKPDKEFEEHFSLPVVVSGGDVIGYYFNNIFGIRPIIRFGEGIEFSAGEKIFLNNTLCTAVDSKTLLADSVVCFSSWGNNVYFDKSDIKTFLSSAEFKEVF